MPVGAASAMRKSSPPGCAQRSVENRHHGPGFPGARAAGDDGEIVRHGSRRGDFLQIGLLFRRGRRMQRRGDRIAARVAARIPNSGADRAGPVSSRTSGVKSPGRPTTPLARSFLRRASRQARLQPRRSPPRHADVTLRARPARAHRGRVALLARPLGARRCRKSPNWRSSALKFVFFVHDSKIRAEFSTKRAARAAGNGSVLRLRRIDPAQKNVKRPAEMPVEIVVRFRAPAGSGASATL